MKLAYFLRHSENLHYFAALKPYLEYFVQQGAHDNFLVLEARQAAEDESPEYAGYTHLFTTNCDLDAYDLVITPTFLRAEERSTQTRVVQIFHSISDKSCTYERDFHDYLLCLCVGHRQGDRLLQYEHNRSMRWAMIGYPKFDNLPTVPALFANDKPTVIYCPTWCKGGMSSIDLFLRHPEVIEQMAAAYNVIVKPHPNIFNVHRPLYDQRIVNQLEALTGVTLIRSGNIISWFIQSHICIGDISASSYEWLFFDRPIIFLNPQPDVLEPSADFTAATYLWQCGDVCQDMRTLPAMIDANLHHDRYNNRRETLLHYSVYNPRDYGATQRGIAQLERVLCSLPRR